jgi:hypothetical protein
VAHANNIRSLNYRAQLAITYNEESQ